MSTSVENNVLSFDPSDATIEPAACEPEAGGGCEPQPSTTGPKDETVDASDQQPMNLSDSWGSLADDANSAVQEPIANAVGAWSVDASVAKLQEGDSFTIKLGAEAKGNVDVEGERTLQVARDATGYTVTASGTAMAKRELEGLKKAGLDEADAKVGGHGELTMRFDNQADAQRAANAIRNEMVSDQVLPLVAGPLAPTVMMFEAANSHDELSDMKSHMTSMELGGDAAIQIEKSTGFDPGSAVTDKLAKLGVQGQVSASAKLVYGDDGNPKELVLTGKVSAQVDAKVGAELGDSKLGGEVRADASGGTLEVAYHEHLPIPPGMKLSDYDNDPIAFAKAVADTMGAAATGETTVKLEGHYGERGVGLELAMTGTPDALASSPALDQLVAGDYRKAAETARASLGASGKGETFREEAHGGEAKVHLGEFELGGTLQSTYRAKTGDLFPAFGGNGNE